MPLPLDSLKQALAGYIPPKEELSDEAKRKLLVNLQPDLIAQARNHKKQHVQEQNKIFEHKPPPIKTVQPPIKWIGDSVEKALEEMNHNRSIAADVVRVAMRRP